MGRISLQVDGVSIDSHEAVLTGGFDVDPKNVSSLAYDEEVMLVITARVRLPKYKENSSGDVTRVNVLKIQEAELVTDPETEKMLSEQFGFDWALRLPLTPEPTPQPERVDVRHLDAVGSFHPMPDPYEEAARRRTEEISEETETEVWSPPEKAMSSDPELVAAGGVRDPHLKAFLEEG